MNAALRLIAPAALLALATSAQANDIAYPILTVPLQPVVGSAHLGCDNKTASGLGFTQLRPGAGPKPGASDLTLISYIGYLAADGQVFDQNPQAVLPVDGVVPGFGEGLQLMTKGSVYRFCIPAPLGYGEAGTGPIPANAALVFQVELMDFKTKAEVEAMRQAETAPTAPAPAP